MRSDQGYTDAQFSLAVKYYSVADQGLADAQYALALCYFHGKGISKDDDQAV